MKKFQWAVFAVAILAGAFLFGNIKFAASQTSPPTPTITQPTNGATVSSPVTVAWSGSVSPYIYTLWRNGTAVSGCIDLSSASLQCLDSGASGSSTYNIAACSGLNNTPPCTGSNSVTVTVGTSSSPPPPPPPPPTTPPPSPVPAAPTLNPLTTTSSTLVNLSWGSVTNAGWYNIYRRTPAGTGSWTLYANNITTVFYTDNGAAAGGSYEYHINACNSSGCSPDSNYQSATLSSGSDTQPPSAPTGVVATSISPSQINLSWAASTDNVGVTGYKIYRGGILWYTTASLSFSDTGLSSNTPYSYYVQAYDAAGNLSSPSVTVSATTQSGTVSCSGLTLTFQNNKTTYAQGDMVNYTYICSPGGTTSFVEISVAKPDGSITVYNSASGSISQNSLGFSTSNLAAGNYTLRACFTAGCSGGVTASLPFTVTTTSSTSDTTPPTAPSYIGVSTTTTYVYISWPASTDNVGVAGYKVYRNGSYLASTSNLTYSDTSVAAGASYNYYIVAYDAAGNISNPSPTTISVAVGSGGGTASSTVPNVPSNLGYNLSNSGATVNLNWTDNSTNEARFEIYRQYGGTWNYLTQTSANVTTFSDNPPAGTYYYQVAACNGTNPNGGCSMGSNTVGPIMASSNPTTPNAPSNLTASASGYNIYLYWTDNSNNESGFKLYRGPIWTDIGNVGANVTYYTDANLPAGTYTYHLQAFVSASGSYPVYSSVSNDVTATVPSGGVTTTSTSAGTPPPSPTPTPPPPLPSGATSTSTAPNAPSNFSYNLSNSGTVVNLSWQDNSTNENWFTIYRQSGGAWSTVGQTGANATSFSDTPPAGTYYYQVSACVSTLCSPGANLGPLSVGVSPGQTTTATSTQTANSTTTAGAFLKGTVNDPSQKPVQGVYVHVFAPDFTFNFSAITDINGSYGVSLPAGTYFVEISPPGARNDLLKPAPQNFSVANGAAITVNLQFGAVSKTITGAALFSNGQPVTDAEVGAYSSVTNQWTSALTDGNGRFTLGVSGGTWQVGIRPQNPLAAKWSWSGNFPVVTFANDSTSETQTANFTIAVSDAKLTVHAVDGGGMPLANAGVVVDVVSAAQAPGTAPLAPPLFQKSDGSGTASFTLKTGNYFLRAFLPPELGYFNPDEQSLSLSSGQSRDITLVFRKRETVAAVTLAGLAKLDDGTPTDAFIWVWSETGETNQLRADANGEFSFPATNGRWHIGAGKEINGIPYKSSGITVDVQGGAPTIEIVLAKIGQNPLAPPVAVSQPPTQQIIAQAQDGAKVTIPENATALTSGNVNVQVKPTIEAPSQAGAKVVSTVYDVSVKSDSGTVVTSLQKNVEITIPYKDEDLKAQGTSADKVVPSFYDESAGTWVKVDNYTIDKDRHVVILRVKHLTRFALVAAADITPPDAPANVSAAKGVPGEVVLTWTNPASDFDHVKIYRSTAAGDLGKLAANNVQGTSVSDTDVVSGTKYYYTVRAVDPAGNESTNTDQVSIRAAGVFKGKPLPPGQATKLAILRALKQGSSGDDVKAMQAILLKEGVYPSGLITGFFGKLTKQAVIRFQEKYADEILKPNGLTNGTGIVGPSTRAKLNTLQ